MATRKMAWAHFIGTRGHLATPAFHAWQVCFTRRAAFCRAAPPERGSAGAHTLDRQDRGDDDDDDDDDDDYNDKRIMVDDAPLRYTRLTAKQRRMLL